MSLVTYCSTASELTIQKKGKQTGFEVTGQSKIV